MGAAGQSAAGTDMAVGVTEGGMAVITSANARKRRVGLGIRFFLKFRFGFSVLKNFGFLDIRNQSVF
jgi:hypothetical protein